MALNPIRTSARDFRSQMLGLPNDTLIPSTEILAKAAQHLELTLAILPKADPLLGGALAMLDRDAQTIWLDSSRNQADRNFFAAHEIAHVIWHERAETSRVNDDIDQLTGYSHRQKRELDANIWAIEFLLPVPALRRAFLDDSLGATEIAERVGIPRHQVLRQMRETLLCPHDASVLSPKTSDPPLDASQLAAATVEHGPFLLSAGPGTGKTRTLAARCEWLIQQKQVRPESILALTYSRKAADELRQRLGSEIAGPWIGTFHSFALETLQRFGDEIGIRPGWKVCTESEALDLLDAELGRQTKKGEVPPPTVSLSSGLKAISRAKDELCSPDVYAQLVESDCESMRFDERALAELREIARIYPVYEEALARARRIDFGGLILLAVKLLETKPAVQNHLRAQFPHVLADEYQDVNFATARMLKLSSGLSGEGLWVVGDHRQSIYRFRGASPANIEQFQIDYPAARSGSLAVNYRSAKSIVDVFQDAAERLSASEAEPFTGWRATLPDITGSQVVKNIVAETQSGQMDAIVSQIHTLKTGSIPYSEQAILCRTNQDVDDVSLALSSRGIPVSAPVGALDRSEIKDLICFLQLFSPQSAITHLTVARAARALGESFAHFLDADPSNISNRTQLLKSRVNINAANSHYPVPTEILESLLFENIVFLRSSLRKSGHSEAAAIKALLDFVAAQEEVYRRDIVAPEQALGSEIDYDCDCVTWVLRALNDADDIPLAATHSSESGDGIKVMTIHAAKGLEFTAVFLPNLSTGKFPVQCRTAKTLEPSGMTVDSIPDAELREESCLFFVALSRAMQYLILSRAERTDESRAVRPPSPFLRLIEGALKRIGCKTERWEDDRRPELTVDSRRDFANEKEFDNAPSLPDIDLYGICPRLFYYRNTYSEVSIRLSATEKLSAIIEAVENRTYTEGRGVQDLTPEKLRAQIYLELAKIDQERLYRAHDQIAEQAWEMLMISQESVDHAPRSHKPGTVSAGTAWRREAAQEGIARRRFPALPSNPQTCKTCAFRFVCPE